MRPVCGWVVRDLFTELSLGPLGVRHQLVEVDLLLSSIVEPWFRTSQGTPVALCRFFFVEARELLLQPR